MPDALAIRRENDGTYTTLEATGLSKNNTRLGAVIGALLGLGANGEIGAEEGAKRGSQELRQAQVLACLRAKSSKLTQKFPQVRHY